MHARHDDLTRPTRGPRQARLFIRTPRPQRDAVPPRRRAPRQGARAADLHADGGPGLRRVRPPVQAAARHVLLRVRRGRDERHGPELAHEGRARGRRHRRVADFGAGRFGRKRHGHPHRQARALLRGGRHRAAPRAARGHRRGHEQPGAAGGPRLPRAEAAAAYRQKVPGGHRRVRPSHHEPLAQVPDPVRGLRVERRAAAPRPLPREAPVLQRRHPGHGRDGPGGGARLFAADGKDAGAAERPDDCDGRRRFRGHRRVRDDQRRDGRRGSQRGGGARTVLRHREGRLAGERRHGRRRLRVSGPRAAGLRHELRPRRRDAGRFVAGRHRVR
mmetsp:Transcript_203/g.620  ORF Transcript_203/g.620 Transcript_203/m.620 type:complete len:331 (+) Transcript_203:486-1478(+)